MQSSNDFCKGMHLLLLLLKGLMIYTLLFIHNGAKKTSSSCYMHFQPLNMVVKITETSHPLMLICQEIRQCVTTIYALFSNNLI